MKRSGFITLFLMLALTACNKNKPAEAPVVPAPAMAPAIAPGTALPPGHPPMTSPVPTMALPSTPSYVQTQTATVVSTIDVPQFTYLEIKQNGTTRWLAAKTIAAKKGDIVKFDNGATMENFNSKTLNRTFPSITFVNNVTVSK
jgi:hypothetical protein